MKTNEINNEDLTPENKEYLQQQSNDTQEEFNNTHTETNEQIENNENITDVNNIIDHDIINSDSKSDFTSEFIQLRELMAELSNQFEGKIKYDKHKDEIIDKLHDELQSHKNDLYRKLLSPILNEIIFLIDDYNSLLKNYHQQDISTINVPKLLRHFGDIPEDLENILYKNGIEPYEVEGDVFDPSKQKVIKVVITENLTKDKTICERLRKGFLWDGKILRMEYVNCYKYQTQ